MAAGYVRLVAVFALFLLPAFPAGAAGDDCARVTSGSSSGTGFVATTGNGYGLAVRAGGVGVGAHALSGSCVDFAAKSAKMVYDTLTDAVKQLPPVP